MRKENCDGLPGIFVVCLRTIPGGVRGSCGAWGIGSGLVQVYGYRDVFPNSGLRPAWCFLKTISYLGRRPLQGPKLTWRVPLFKKM